jgi:hypothetical protein
MCYVKKDMSEIMTESEADYKLEFFISILKTNQMHNISNLFLFYFGTTLYMFRTVPPSIIRSLRLYIQHQVFVIQFLWLLATVAAG